MPKVDCWRLLGISPEAGPAEVRAAFARRARDVHPDQGGTGDGLTLRLLAEARDEALAQLRMRAGDGPAPQPEDGCDQPGGDAVACHDCGRPFPRERLAHRLVGGGWRGRAASTLALVCRACATRAEERRRNRRFIAMAGCMAMLFLLGLALA